MVMEKVLREKLPGGKFESVSPSLSRHMAGIAKRSRGKGAIERRFRGLLVQGRMRGWTTQARDVPGTPDFYFPEQEVAVFLDGCFWHGCPRCGHVPKTNAPFWSAKIVLNQEKDRRKDALLRERGVRVLRLWEHEVQNEAAACLDRRRALLSDVSEAH